MHQGVSLDLLPFIDTSSTPSDVLTYAEILRSKAAMFLSPEEITEKCRAINFHRHVACWPLNLTMYDSSRTTFSPFSYTS